MPTIDIPNKICPHCGGIKWVVLNRTKKLASGETKTYTFYTCSIKNYENGKKWRKNHIEKHRKTRREYVKKKRIDCETFAKKERQKARDYQIRNRNKRAVYRKSWASANLEKDRAYYRKSAKKQSENLTDYYISRRIIGRDPLLKRGDIPQELIKLKRKQLLLKRKIKNNG